MNQNQPKKPALRVALMLSVALLAMTTVMPLAAADPVHVASDENQTCVFVHTSELPRGPHGEIYVCALK
jgi:hypothetical protein